MSERLRPPPRRRLLRETRVLGDAVHMITRLTRRPNLVAQGDPVLLLPGFGAGPRFMEPLRVWLRRHGFAAEHWGLGRNLAGLDLRHRLEDIGPTWALEPLPVYRREAGVPLLCDRMVEIVRRRNQDSGRRIALVGWSLGGTIAREVARDAPDAVASVITLGSPVIGGPKYTAAASRLTARGLDLDWIERQVERRAERPLRVPVTAIVSPSDAVVAVEAAYDRRQPGTRYRLIDAAHLGLAINPRVWDAILEALTTPESADPDEAEPAARPAA